MSIWLIFWCKKQIVNLYRKFLSGKCKGCLFCEEKILHSFPYLIIIICMCVFICTTVFFMWSNSSMPENRFWKRMGVATQKLVFYECSGVVFQMMRAKQRYWYDQLFPCIANLILTHSMKNVNLSDKHNWKVERHLVLEISYFLFNIISFTYLFCAKLTCLAYYRSPLNYYPLTALKQNTME